MDHQQIKPSHYVIVSAIFAFGMTAIFAWLDVIRFAMVWLFGALLALTLLTRKKARTPLGWKVETLAYGVAAMIAFVSGRAFMGDAEATDKGERTPVDVSKTQKPDTAPTPESATPVADQPTVSVPLVTTIDEVLDAYAANQIAAAKRFGSTPVEISGEVVRVREAFGTGFAILRSLKTNREQEFGFSDGGTKQLVAVSPGDRVKVTCPNVMEAMSIVLTVNCSKIEPE
ncbi:hypothetical protein [Tsuneonella troitsensis]|uniref:hypothetical protein n=1 Tax=Tsuneonella troitsensis TaxID=292222 RepID=UPI00070E915D|nr:hypothetical protein [Tsuneonella troitsensis]